MLSVNQKEFEKALLKMEDFNWDFYFKYLEALIDPRKFHNIQKWLDRKVITAAKKYKEESNEIKMGR